MLFQGRCTWAGTQAEKPNERGEDEDREEEPEPEVGPPLLTPVSQDAGTVLTLPDKLALVSYCNKLQWYLTKQI